MSALLVAMSRPDPRDVFLDPFAGSGSIVSARLAMPARRVIYNDIDRQLYHSAMARLGSRMGLVFTHEDGVSMASIASGEVSVIVTDPPWGEYEEAIREYDKFINAVAAEFSRMLNLRSGRLVVLVSRRRQDQALQALAEQGFYSEPPIGILVNGHPASVIRSNLVRR
jgi:tRNA G10  N-methylase Trm11